MSVALGASLDNLIRSIRVDSWGFSEALLIEIVRIGSERVRGVLVIEVTNTGWRSMSLECDSSEGDEVEMHFVLSLLFTDDSHSRLPVNP